jgi:Chalcone isomerase-like
MSSGRWRNKLPVLAECYSGSEKETHVPAIFVNQALHMRCIHSLRAGRYGEMISLLKKLRALLCAMVLGVCTSSWAVHLAGVDVPEHVQVAGSDSVLNGAGVRRAYFLEVYVASLYLPQRQKDTAAILNMPGSKRLQMIMLMSASSQDFNKAMVKGMRRNSTDDEYHHLQSRISDFERIINGYGAVKRGDVISIDYVPGKGTAVSVNGQMKDAQIAGEDFYKKILEIFLGTNVNDAELKQKLLGY